MAEIIITKSNFESEVINSSTPVMVDFWASWCGPCKMLEPIISELAEDYKGRVKVGKVNVDEEQELAGKYGIEAIPTAIVFKDGKQVDTSVGYRPKEEFCKILESVL